MRVLLDTNVVVSALLFGGRPRVLLHALRRPHFEIWTSREMLRELLDTLSEWKFPVLARAEVTGAELAATYARRAFVVHMRISQ